MERTIISSILKSRRFFSLIDSAIVPSEDISDLGNIVYSVIKDFYESDPSADSVDIPILTATLRRKYEKHFNLLNTFLSSDKQISEPNLLRELTAVKLQAVSRKLAGAFLSNNNKTDIRPLLDQYLALQNVSEPSRGIEAVSQYAEEELTALTLPENIIKLTPDSINEKIGGGALRGHHILIFARPDSGKTQFAINLMRGFIRTGLRVLYIGNEDPKRQVISRVISRITNRIKEEVLRDPEEASQIARDRGLDNLYIEELIPGTLYDIRGLCKSIHPDVVLIDQLKNLRVTKGASRVDQLEIVATGARNIAKEFNTLVISITQAADSASNKLVLDMGDVYYSNTGIPGQCDLMIGIGCNEDFKQNATRMISICKNKLSEYHGYFPMKVDESLSKFIDL